MIIDTLLLILNQYHKIETLDDHLEKKFFSIIKSLHETIIKNYEQKFTYGEYFF